MIEFEKLIPYLKCPRCGHEWEKRVNLPQKCPNCQFKLRKPVMKEATEKCDDKHKGEID